MTARTILAALALALSPAVASAMCGDRHSTAATCPQGEVFDPARGICVTPVTG